MSRSWGPEKINHIVVVSFKMMRMPTISELFCQEVGEGVEWRVLLVDEAVFKEA
jgi:hypothetical protein